MRDYLETTVLYLVSSIILFVVILIASGEGEVEEGAIIALFIILAIGTIVWLVSFVFLKLWIDTFKYEFTANEVIVRKGWITKTKKIVPYRTITNFHKKRGPFDRIMGLSTMEVETAGRSGSSSGPEEKLEGILVEEVDQFMDLIRAKVRHLKGAAAISHDADESSSLGSTDDILLEILSQLKKMNK